ncbi:hypothetical protein GCM10010405_17430 [Streptomyces macrosporus]|uniref:Uncharacterized protein n=1 Tax=Streptomyces macrosporus TaxID=44032 RepID=A0ABN3JQY1_9ACTN
MALPAWAVTPVGADGGRASPRSGPQAASSRQATTGTAGPDIRPMDDSRSTVGSSGKTDGFNGLDIYDTGSGRRQVVRSALDLTGHRKWTDATDMRRRP